MIRAAGRTRAVVAASMETGMAGVVAVSEVAGLVSEAEVAGVAAAS